MSDVDREALIELCKEWGEHPASLAEFLATNRAAVLRALGAQPYSPKSAAREERTRGVARAMAFHDAADELRRKADALNRALERADDD